MSAPRTTLALLLACLLAGCGGPLSGVRLTPAEESQRRTMVSVTFPSLDRTDAVIRGWEKAKADSTLARDLVFAYYGLSGEPVEGIASDKPVGLAVVRADVPERKDGPPVAVMVSALSFSLKSWWSSPWLASLGWESRRAGPST